MPFCPSTNGTILPIQKAHKKFPPPLHYQKHKRSLTSEGNSFLVCSRSISVRPDMEEWQLPPPTHPSPTNAWADGGGGRKSFKISPRAVAQKRKAKRRKTL
ncbi:hypothetical protein CDAR_117541 [Caerostris darwini]|uniref:Uncharacterized protein n=1 Tax=Caerostris darwini TaxID=1538125 RepID=A0AAV4WMY2_9ARAC|nr:hypothetical protein CDAR_117541 [Caerostris darwini]